MTGANPRTVSFHLASGETLWIGGRSGAGKSTLLRTLGRLLAPAGGRLLLKGVPWADIPAVTWRIQVTYLHQKPVLFAGSVRENLDRGLSFQSVKRNPTGSRDPAALLCELRLPTDVLDRDALTLSVGESARVALVRSLLISPKVLLLDEITAGLDQTSADAVGDVLDEWLRAGDHAIFGVSHDDRLPTRLPGSALTLD